MATAETEGLLVGDTSTEKGMAVSESMSVLTNIVESATGNLQGDYRVRSSRGIGRVQVKVENRVQPVSINTIPAQSRDWELQLKKMHRRKMAY